MTRHTQELDGQPTASYPCYAVHFLCFAAMNFGCTADHPTRAVFFWLSWEERTRSCVTSGTVGDAVSYGVSDVGSSMLLTSAGVSHRSAGSPSVHGFKARAGSVA